MKHKWHKEIKAWADGAEIEHRWIGDKDWSDVKNPVWTSNDVDFRIKPQPKEPQYLYLFGEVGGTISYRKERHGFQYMGTYIGKIKLEQDDE